MKAPGYPGARYVITDGTAEFSVAIRNQELQVRINPAVDNERKVFEFTVWQPGEEVKDYANTFHAALMAALRTADGMVPMNLKLPSGKVVSLGRARGR